MNAATLDEAAGEPRLLSVVASVALHVALVIAVMLVPAARRLVNRPDDEAVSVSILSPRQFREAVEPSAPAEPMSGPGALEPAPAAAPIPLREDGMVRPSTMLSGRTLADPRSRQARADLATFDATERRIQLCNLEAMDQVAAWRKDFRPDRVVAYATAEAVLEGRHLRADGAAMRSRRRWYALKFECDLAAADDQVVGFAFSVGDAIPRSRWSELGLAPVN